MFDAMPSSLPFVKDKRLRALAIDAPRRSRALPEVATLLELDLSGYEASPWFGIALPAGASKTNVDQVHRLFAAALKNPEVI